LCSFINIQVLDLFSYWEYIPNMRKETYIHQNALSRFIMLLMKPVVRILLRSGVGFSDFAEWAKLTYVEIAEKEFGVEGRVQSTSRISILTGLHRKEVARIRKDLEQGGVSERNVPANRAERVVNAWLRESRYSSDESKPLDLPYSSDTDCEPSFESLVKSYSGDIHSRTLLDELIRIGAVSQLSNDHLRLERAGYVPSTESVEQLGIAGQSAHDLIATLANNINPESSGRYFQRSVAYRHLSNESVSEFKEYSELENEKLLLKLNKWLAQRDMSIEEQETADCQYRVGVGVYYFQESSSESNSK
jgi:hypothetical protein